jgi:hypothetical protein
LAVEGLHKKRVRQQEARGTAEAYRYERNATGIRVVLESDTPYHLPLSKP